MITFLWTDLFIWLLVITWSILFFRMRKKNYFHTGMEYLLKSKTFIISGLILLTFVSIALLDSIHYRPLLENSSSYGNAKSFLDYLLWPWSEHSETTFSAPFSSKSYIKDRVIDSRGLATYEYPELLKLNIINNQDLIKSIMLILSINFLLLGIFIVLVKKIKQQQLKYAVCKTVIYTLFTIVLTTSIVLFLYKYYHVLGTDKIGKDILYTTIKSIRTGVVIGTLTTIFMLPFALLLGTLAGYFGGRYDDFIQYLYTTLSSIPSVLLIAAFILIIQTQLALHPTWVSNIASQADIRLLALCFILGITSWSSLCRLLRAETLKIRELDYVLAAKTMQVSDFRIIARHVIPNLSHIIIISITLDFSSLVLAEAVLSYIGVGVDPTTMSWGNMINSARLELAREPIVWWPIVGAFIPMFIFVLALNLFAEQIREAFNPRARLQ